MPKLDKTQYSKEEAARLMEIRRLEKLGKQKKEVFAAVGRQSKLFWSSLLGISVLSQFISVWTQGSNYGILQLVGLILSIVYLVDQRPKMNEIRGK